MLLIFLRCYVLFIKLYNETGFSGTKTLKPILPQILEKLHLQYIQL